MKFIKTKLKINVEVIKFSGLQNIKNGNCVCKDLCKHIKKLTL